MNGELKSRPNFPPEALGRLIIDMLEQRASAASFIERRCLHRACRILLNQTDPRDIVTDAETQTDAPVECPTTRTKVNREDGARQAQGEVPNANANVNVNANANANALVAPVKEEQRVPAQGPENLLNCMFNGRALVGDGQTPRPIPLDPVCAGLADPRNRANGYGVVKEEPRGAGGEMVPVLSTSFASEDADDVEIVAEVVKILKPVGQRAKSENVHASSSNSNSSSSVGSQRIENSPVSSSSAAARQNQIKLESIASPEDNTDVVDMDISTPPEPPRLLIVLPARVPQPQPPLPQPQPPLPPQQPPLPPPPPRAPPVNPFAFNPFVKRE